MALPPTFERLHRDPRPMAPDLKRVLTGTLDSRHMVQDWQHLPKKWWVPSSRIEYRFLLAFDPTIGGDQISDCRSANRWLQKEDDKWNGRAPDDGFLKNKNIKWLVGALHENFRNEDLEKAVRPAFGFWLFPVDALGPLHEEGVSKEEGFRSRAKAILDMIEHWPGLALSILP
ncbi:hypothetical protein MMC21_006505 [Puttea exsequens]|nr:hypothetical protein [Puttea exsequens]